MPKMFCLINMNGGSDPQLDRNVTPYHGSNHIGNINHQWGAYLISGLAGELIAIDALPQVVGIVAVTEKNDIKWAELDGVVTSSVRTKLNTWLTNRGYPNIPSGWTNRRVVKEVFQRLNAGFDFDLFNIEES